MDLTKATCKKCRKLYTKYTTKGGNCSRICPECRGKVMNGGRLKVNQVINWIICPECRGKKKVLRIFPGPQRMVNCRLCKGKGEIKEKK